MCVDYAMAHAGKAILPVKSVGEFGKRIGVQVDGDSLTVGAYATKSDSGTRYSIVVMNTYVHETYHIHKFSPSPYLSLVLFLALIPN